MQVYRSLGHETQTELHNNESRNMTILKSNAFIARNPIVMCHLSYISFIAMLR